MKKVLSNILILIVSFLFLTGIVDAETYKRGIITASSTVKTDSTGKTNLMSVSGASMTLSLPEAVEIIGESGSYYQIKFMWSGYLYAGYVPKSNVYAAEYTIDENYKQLLISQGFPLDYAKKLAILHAIHPNWVFTPSFAGKVQGGMDFYTAVNGEAAVVDRNLIDSSVSSSLRSTADGAYSNGVWKQFSGGGWYAASTQAIAFYMDPRNFLDESHIFMFENQAYNGAVQYRPAIEKALTGTFMADPFTCIVGSNNCTIGTHYFVDTFLESGAGKGVNPVHLTSRVLKEQGQTGSLLSVGKGYNGQYIGYYNFFNISANGATQADVILNGLMYAYNRGWNNQHISIYDGAGLIGNNYVGRGQSNGYYQKFNTIAPSYYGNQYMQNIRAPYSEAYSTYTNYYKTFSTREEWDNNIYEFLIPIYQNMGTATSLDTSFNSDATLKSLSIPECKFNLDFSSSIYEYDCYTESSTKAVTVSATTTNPLAKVSYPASVKLTENDTTITINVTAANGLPAAYIIRVHKIVKDSTTPLEILNNVGYKVSGEYVYNIMLGSDISNMISSIRNSYHFADVQVVQEDGTPITSGYAVTNQIITITNAGQTKSFKLVIYGNFNGDEKIDIRDLLIVQKHILKASVLTDAYAVAADINRDGLVDIRDLLLVQKHILNDALIEQG